MLMWLSTINAAYIYHDAFPSQDEHTQERMANDKRIAMFIDELEDSRIGQAMDSMSSSDFPSAISSVQDRRASNLPTQALFQKGSEATKTVKDEEVFHDSNDSSTPAKKVEVKDTPTEGSVQRHAHDDRWPWFRQHDVDFLAKVAQRD